MEIDNQGYNITRTKYKGFEIVVKSKEHRGMKALCIENDKVIFNQNFQFIKPEQLLTRMYKRVDMYLSGEWVPAKVIKRNQQPNQS